MSKVLTLAKRLRAGDQYISKQTGNLVTVLAVHNLNRELTATWVLDIADSLQTETMPHDLFVEVIHKGLPHTVEAHELKPHDLVQAKDDLYAEVVRIYTDGNEVVLLFANDKFVILARDHKLRRIQ